jgi:hypothetical protein
MLQNDLDNLYNQQLALYDQYANYYNYSDIAKDISVRFNPNLNMLAFLIQDQLHRLDGPAIVYLDKDLTNKYYIYGEQYSKEDYDAAIERIKMM